MLFTAFLVEKAQFLWGDRLLLLWDPYSHQDCVHDSPGTWILCCLLLCQLKELLPAACSQFSVNIQIPWITGFSLAGKPALTKNLGKKKWFRLNKTYIVLFLFNFYHCFTFCKSHISEWSQGQVSQQIWAMLTSKGKEQSWNVYVGSTFSASGFVTPRT